MPPKGSKKSKSQSRPADTTDEGSGPRGNSATDTAPYPSEAECVEQLDKIAAKLRAQYDVGEAELAFYLHLIFSHAVIPKLITQNTISRASLDRFLQAPPLGRSNPTRTSAPVPRALHRFYLGPVLLNSRGQPNGAEDKNSTLFRASHGQQHVDFSDRHTFFRK